VNVEGTRRVAEAAARAGVPRLAYFSGLGVAHYGMARRTTNRYFLSKLSAEAALFRSGLALEVFRPSYVVGPGDALVRGLLREMAGGVVERPGDGRYRMQPVAVSDAAAAILAAVGGGPAATDPPHRVYDLVGPEPIAFDAFVARLAARARAHGLRAEYEVLAVPVAEGDRQARSGGYRGLQPDELDCMLCDEVSDPAPLARLLGRPLTALDAAIDSAIAAAASGAEFTSA
jgi:nucleoside-diphosphate-sugar epimerase